MVAPAFYSPSFLMAASTLTGAAYYELAIEDLAALTTDRAFVTVGQVLPIAIQLQTALRELDIPLIKLEAIDEEIRELQTIARTDPETVIPINILLTNLHREELLPRPNESIPNALARLKQMTRGEAIPLEVSWLHLLRSPGAILRQWGRGFGSLLLRTGARLQRPPKTTAIYQPVFPATSDTIEQNRATIPESRVMALEEHPPDERLVDTKTGCLLVRRDFMAGTSRFDGIAVSDYQLQGQAGQGGMARVYAGLELGAGRTVAIKVASLPPGETIKRQHLMERFRNEQRLQGSAESERIVRVYTTGIAANGEPYIVMEFLGGGSLQDYLYEDGRSFELDTITDLAEQAAAAVSESHQQEIIHRDIKPGNFFRTDEGRLKLGDFGIAIPAEDSEEDSQFNRHVFGTPGYIPPESWLLEPDSYRRDVFALGAMLYEMFTEELPYPPSSNFTAHYLQMIEGSLPPLPSQVVPDRNIPPVLDRIIMKALSIKPEDRYADAHEMLLDLLTYRAQAHEERAHHFAEQPSIHPRQKLRTMAQWREAMEAALREYRMTYDRYQEPDIGWQMIRINRQLYDWAEIQGEQEIMQRAIEEIARLDSSGEIALSIDRPVELQVSWDPVPSASRPPTLTLHRFVDHNGFLEQDGTQRLDPTTLPVNLSLPRGPAYALQVKEQWMHPLFIPLPVRPSHQPHQIRIPFYGANDIPEDFLVIPAGPVAVRNLPGRYGEKMETIRQVPRDYAMGPKVTNAQYLNFLKATRASIADNQGERLTHFSYRYIPRHWNRRIREGLIRGEPTETASLQDQNRQRLDPNAPITHIPYEAGIAYLQWAYPNRGARYPTPDEWKRAFRGNDFRSFPWGDATPIQGTGDWRYPGHETPSQPLPAHTSSARDRSPFSIYSESGLEQGLFFLVSGTQIYLANDDPERFLPAVGLTRVDPADSATVASYALLAGQPYYAPAPTNAEILSYVVIDDHWQRKDSARPQDWEPSYVGATGIVPVIPLRSAPSTPHTETLRS